MIQFSDSRPRSVVSSDLKIDGNLVTTGELEVSGKIKGEIGAATMVLHPTADIEGQISAGDLVNNGTLTGTAVNGGAKTGHLAAQNPASGGAPSDMARALLR